VPVAGEGIRIASGSVITAAKAWDYRHLPARPPRQGVAHYRDIPHAGGALVEHIGLEQRIQSNSDQPIDLYVYDANGNLLGSSVSTVDNGNIV